MLTATEAKQKTQQNIEETVKTQLEEVEKLIDEAIAENRYAAIYEGNLYSQAVEQLSSMGYKLYARNHISGDCEWEISWFVPIEVTEEQTKGD